LPQTLRSPKVGVTITGLPIGFEMALWDLTGSGRSCLPTVGRVGFRDKIRIYADCHAGEGLERLDAVLHSRAASWAPS
jgi:hypothetical protein